MNDVPDDVNSCDDDDDDDDNELSSLAVALFSTANKSIAFIDESLDIELILVVAPAVKAILLWLCDSGDATAALRIMPSIASAAAAADEDDEYDADADDDDGARDNDKSLTVAEIFLGKWSAKAKILKNAKADILYIFQQQKQKKKLNA